MDVLWIEGPAPAGVRACRAAPRADVSIQLPLITSDRGADGHDAEAVQTRRRQSAPVTQGPPHVNVHHILAGAWLVADCRVRVLFCVALWGAGAGATCIPRLAWSPRR